MVRPANLQRLADAYVAYRLNPSELSALLCEPDNQELFDHYCDRGVDWRGTTSDLSDLRLHEELRELRGDQVWSPYQRALQRRLSDPGAPEPPTSEPQTLDQSFRSVVEESFNDWDRDGDGHLTFQEIDHVMSGGFYGEWLQDAENLNKAASLAVLGRYHTLLQSGDPYDGPGITVSDMAKISQGTASVNEAFHGYLAEAATFQKGEPLAEESIEPHQITQGTVGSCVMLSTLIGCSADHLRAMVVEENGKTVVVRFPDGSREEVTEPTLAERFYHARGGDGDRWPAVLEKAMAQKLFQEQRAGDRSLRSAIDGIDPERALEVLTGQTAVKYSLDEATLDQTREHLHRLCGNGGPERPVNEPTRQPVICASRPEALGDFISVEELHNGIVNSHCYAVLDFDPERDIVTLQNPWHRKEWRGSTDGNDDGRFEMPLLDFYCSFRWLAGVQVPQPQSQLQ